MKDNKKRLFELMDVLNEGFTNPNDYNEPNDEPNNTKWDDFDYNLEDITNSINTSGLKNFLIKSSYGMIMAAITNVDSPEFNDKNMVEDALNYQAKNGTLDSKAYIDIWMALQKKYGFDLNRMIQNLQTIYNKV